MQSSVLDTKQTTYKNTNPLSGVSPLIQALIADQTDATERTAVDRRARTSDSTPSSHPAPSALPAGTAAPPASTMVSQEESEVGDPELGVIRLRDRRQDPELGIVRLRNPLQDPELGVLHLRSIVPEPPPRPVLFVSSSVTVTEDSNVLLIDDPELGIISGGVLRTEFAITAFPRIGPRTNILTSVEANLQRFQESKSSNYDELRLRTSLRHNFTNRVYGQLGWSGQLVFDEGFSDQFFTRHGVELILGRRDNLLPRLTLDSFYQSQLFFSNPDEFSRFVQTGGFSLGYRLNQQWSTGLAYSLTLSDFIEVRRHDSFHLITGQIRYSLSPTVRLSLFGGASFGDSSRSAISFDRTFIGITIDANLRVF